MSRWRLARWAAGVAIVVALLAILDPQAAMARLAGANLALVGAAVGGLAAVHLLGAATWRELTARLAGVVLDWPSAIRLYYAGQALGGVTPANLGSDAYRVVALRAAGQGTGAVALPIVVQRATSYLATALIGLTGLSVVAIPAGVPAALFGALLVGSGLVLAAAAVVWLRPPARVAAARALLAPAVGIGLGLAVSFHVAAVGLTFLVVVAVDPSAAAVAPAALAAVAVARVSLLVPLTPSGLGIGETALAVLFVGIGLPAESAVAASLLARLGLVATTVIGGLALAGSTGRPVAWTPVEPEGRTR